MPNRNIKGLTIQIDGDTKKLLTALKGVDSQLKTTQSNLKDIDRLLKLDPGNTELLTQKQKSLKSAISDTSERLKTLKSVQKDALSTEEYDALQREIIETEKNLESLKKEYKDFGSVATQKLKAIGNKLKEMGGKISDAGRAIMPVSAAMAGLGVVTATKFAEVDKIMQLTNKTMGNTAEEAKLLDDAMSAAAANSTFGMSDAATASLNFARAGLKAEQAAAALAPAMNLAAGEGGDLDTVSAGLVATINGFHDSFEDAGHYADVFAAACNNSALDVDSLSSAMSVAAPIFSAAGYSVNDAALYMGVMANNGIEANKAANSLKTGLARLVSPAKEGYEAMKQLGIEVTNADGSMKDSVTIQKELHEAFSKLSESEQIAAASAIFGKNQMAPWLALINAAPDDVDALSRELKGASISVDSFAKNLGKSGNSIDDMKSNLEKLGISSKDFDDILKTSGGNAQQFAEDLWEAADGGVSFEQIVKALGGDLGGLQSVMDSTKGTTDEMAEAMMGGFGGSLEKVKSSLDVLMTSLGRVLAEFLTPIIAGIQSAVDWLNSLDEDTRKTIVTIGALIAAAGPLLIGAGKLTTAIGGIITVLSGPAGIAIAIAGVVAAGVYMVKHWDEVKEKAKVVWEKIKGFFVDGWEKIKAIKWKDLGKAMWDWITQAFEDVAGWASETFNSAVTAIKAIKWKDVGKQVWDWIKSAFSTIESWASETFNSAVTAIKAIKWKDVGESIWNWIKTGVAGWAIGTWNTVSSWFSNIFSTAVSAIKDIEWGEVGDAIWGAIKNALWGIGDWLTDVFKEPINAVIGLVNSLINGVENGVNGVIDGINSALSINWTIPNIFGDDWKIKWSPNIKRVSWKGLDYLANGGTLSEGQRAIVGEYAPEYLTVRNGQAVVRPIEGAQRFGDNVTNTFNVYAQPGQSPEQIAREVERIMTREQAQRRAAYA